jgi:hypothetical protein
MKKRTRLVTGLFVVVVLLFIWIFHSAETKALEKSLIEQAGELMDQYPASETEAVLSQRNVSIKSAAGRTVPLLGEIWGKITVYTRTEEASGKTIYRAIEHFYVYEDGKWRMTESGGCTGPACRLRAEKAFREEDEIPEE